MARSKMATLRSNRANGDDQGPKDGGGVVFMDDHSNECRAGTW